jgi:hypothetical protein
MKPQVCAAAVSWMVVLLGNVVAGQQAQVQEGAAIPQPLEPPGYVIEEAAVRAAPEAGALRGTMSVHVRSLTKAGAWVPLFRGNVGVSSAEASGGGWFGSNPTPMRRQDAVGLLLPGKGEYSVDLQFATPITHERQANSALIPMVPALSGAYDITLDGTNLEVSLQPDVPYQQKVVGGKTVVTVYGSAQTPLFLLWKAGPEVRVVETIAFADQSTLLNISPGLLRVETEIEYTLLQGSMPEASVELPAGYSVLKVEGDNLRNWDIKRSEGKPDTLVLGLLEPSAGQSAVKLVLEKTLDPVPVEFEAPQVVVLGVKREKGTVGVAVEKGLQAEIVAQENIGQVNPSEMPAEFQSLAEQFSLGLKYLARPFRVQFRVSTIEPKVYAEVSCVTVASLERFRQSWDVHYEIRNAGLFQLKLKLAPGMKLISLRGESINNQSLDSATNVLTVDLRSKAEGAYQLSLQTSSEVDKAENAVVPGIELLGAERQWGTIAVSADSGIAAEAKGMSGIGQIDVAELKGMGTVQTMVAGLRAADPLLAFRYLTFPYKLELTVSHVKPELKCEPLHLVQITRKSLRYHSAFNYHIKKAGVFQVRLHVPPELRPSLTLTGPKVEDYSYDPATSVLTVQLVEKTMDELQIELETETLLGKELPKPGMSDAIVVPAIYTLDCEQERGYVAVGTDESIRLKRSGEAGALHDVDVQEIPPALLQRAQNAKLAFRLTESPWALEVEATSITPKITVQTFNYERFGEDYMLGASTVEFTIQYAGVNELRVRLPRGVTEPNIRGENIKIQEKVKEEPKGGAAAESLVGGREGPAQIAAGDLWRIELQSEAKGSYQLIFEYTKDLDPKETRRQFSGPTVMGEMNGVEREIGYLAITADPSLELTPIEAELQSLTPVDEEEIPLKFRELPPSVASQIGRQTVPILFAFRYLAHPYDLVLSSVRHAEADVVTAVVESCKLDTTLTREGNRITSMVANVRSRYEPFLEIQLPEGAKMWHAIVNGRRMRPLTEKAPQGEITKIPIAQVQGVTGPVQVELQWEEFSTSRLGRLQTVRLTAPPLGGVRILRLGWVLQLPRDYSVLSSSGTLERLPSESYFEESLRNLHPMAQPTPSAQEVEAASASSAQQVSNVSVLSGRAAGKQAARPEPVYGGNKPELPQRFCFQGLILNPAVPAEARVTCATSSALTPLTAALVLVVFGFCALLWYRLGFSDLVRFIVLVAALLIVAGLRVIAEQNYAGLLLAAIYTIAAAIVVFGLLAVYKGAAWRRSQAPPQPEQK